MLGTLIVRNKLYLLPNLFIQNTIPFLFSIQPEPRAVIDCQFLLIDILWFSFSSALNTLQMSQLKNVFIDILWFSIEIIISKRVMSYL